MNTGVPGPTDYSSPRTASAGPRRGNGGQGSQPRGFPSGNLRISDAERDAALGELSQHYQAGRLTIEELDERTSLILAARTGNELEVQLRDLPNLAASAAPPPPNRQPGMASYAAPRIALTIVILAAIAGVLALTSGHHGDHSWGSVVPVLIILVLVRRFIRHR